MNRDTLATVGAVLLVLGCGAWFYLNFERTTEREQVGYQGEALRNRFLAAQRLFERMGVSARELRPPLAFEGLPADATVFLPRYRTARPARELDALLAFVDAGGHLIVEAEDHKSKDILLERLGVGRAELKMQAPRSPSNVTLPHAPETMRVRFRYRQKLAPPPAAAYHFDDLSGTQVVHLRRNRGRATVLPDFSFLTNHEIARNDHAEFAWQLVRFAPASREVIVVSRFETPSLANWLVEHALAVLAASAALLALWLWHVVPRFGPLKPDPALDRRRLLDHLRATGRYYWARGGATRLLAAAREAALRNVGRSQPGIVDLPRAERVMRIAELTRLDANRIDSALYDDATEAARFTGAIRTLQRIEDRLVRNIEEST